MQNIQLATYVLLLGGNLTVFTLFSDLPKHFLGSSRYERFKAFSYFFQNRIRRRLQDVVAVVPEPGGPGGSLAPQYLADQLTLFEPGRADYPHLLHAIWSYKEQSYKEPALRFWKK